MKSISTFLLLLLFVPTVVSQMNYSFYEYSIDFSQPGKTHVNYWHATGFTPGELLFRDDMQLTLDYLSAIPNSGLVHIRPHWMLNLVGSRNAGTPEATYNFDRLGAAFDELVSRGLKPIFEVMGFPAITWETGPGEYDAAAQSQRNQPDQWIPDFENMEDVRLWYDFVKEMTTYLEDRYGVEELKTWYFECTNEPDIHNHFWSYGIPALLNYWDATSEAIKAVNPDYQFGGPGTARGVSDEFKAVLAHCDTGTNVITGEQGAVLDYISVHRKFLPYVMIDRELECIEYIRENHPRFKDLPFWNDEADPMAGWSRSYWWRPHPWYGAFVIQSVDAHNRLLIDSAGVNYQMLLNDNGFMGNWYHRTQLARFLNTDETNEEVRFWLFKKPVLTVMTMLALGEGNRYDVEGYATTREHVIVVPSRTPSNEIVLLILNKPEFGPVHNNWVSNRHITPEQKVLHDPHGANLTLNLQGLNFEKPVLRHVRLDELHGYAHGAWRALGSPDSLSADMYRVIAAHMDPVMIDQRQTDEISTLHLQLPPSSVSMVIISDAHNNVSHSTPEIRSINDYSGYNGEQKKFIRWEQMPGMIVRYHVYASYDGGEYHRVSPYPLFDLGYLDVLPDGVSEAEYRIEVVY